MELLEDEAEPLVTHAGEIFVAIALDRLAVEGDLPTRGLVEEPHQVEQRALAATRGTHHRNEFPLVDRQVDVVESRRFDALRAIFLGYLLQMDHGAVLLSNRSSPVRGEGNLSCRKG
jgi:hypothetical protein